MSENQKQLNIKNLLEEYSIETTPNVYSKFGKFEGLVSLDNSIYVTYLPDVYKKTIHSVSSSLKSDL